MYCELHTKIDNITLKDILITNICVYKHDISTAFVELSILTVISNALIKKDKSKRILRDGTPQ